MVKRVGTKEPDERIVHVRVCGGAAGNCCLYPANVAAVLPLSDDMVSLASAGIFALRYLDHPLTTLYKEVAAKLVA